MFRFTAVATVIAVLAFGLSATLTTPEIFASDAVGTSRSSWKGTGREAPGKSGGSNGKWATTTTVPSTTTTVAGSTTTVPSTTTTVPGSTTTTVPSTTTTVPSSTTTTTVAALPSGYVSLKPGDDVAAIVNSHPAGTTFVFTAGEYRGVKLYPKDGQSFIGEPGAILLGSGQNVAFSGDSDDVVIDNLIIDGYSPASQGGMIQVGSATGWTIRNSEFRNSATGGLNVRDGFMVTNNYIHHNRQLGIKAHGQNVLIEGNEISYNNYLSEYDQAWEAGGSKFVQTTNMIVRNNYVHDNTGAGLWTDGSNSATLYENNVVLDNSGPGIFHEISYSAVIRNNQVERNGFGFYRGGILIANAQDVQVYGNTLVDNDGGVILIHDNRGSGSQGTYHTRNITVTDNFSAYSVNATGIFKNADGDTSGIVFDRNTYVVSGDAYRWEQANWNTSEWQASGQDLNGIWE